MPFTPLVDASVDTVVSTFTVCTIPGVLEAIRSIGRVLKPGGLMMTSTTSITDSPELAHVWQRERTTFDAEEAPEIVARHFEEVELDRWDGPYVRLPDQAALRDYLVGRLMPRDEATKAAQQIETPLDVTKRGVMIFARRLRI